MPITHTNRKGVTYTLCRSTTKTGKLRYRFAREPRGEPVEEIPEGWTISESVNGIVSLVKERPSPIMPEEIAAVEAAVQRHPKPHRYRVAVKGERIVVHESASMVAESVIPMMAEEFAVPVARLGRALEEIEANAQFRPALRFTLVDADRRTFIAERLNRGGHSDFWQPVGRTGPLEPLARQVVPGL